ncbi:MAG: YdiU family protein [Actinomycetota bacterium]
MSVVAPPSFGFEHTFADGLDGLYAEWAPAPVPHPELAVFNESLASELGLDIDHLQSTAGVRALAGDAAPPDARPLAQAYSGHQFGGYSPRLGDGRAVLLGELVDNAGVRRDLHLKGSGRTPFARGGDGKAVLGPMLREYLFGEAMHALGIPTTRALAVVTTGESVTRETALPGAVLARVASSHLRVGTFQYAAATGDAELMDRLVRYAAERHVPAATGETLAEQAAALFAHVVDVQAALIADWMAVGFIHGVMNTDNVTISGETIDYGPCAFLDAYDAATVFSSIDHGGRYAFGNQPAIGAWNLARLAETLVPVVDDDPDRAVQTLTAALEQYPLRFGGSWLTHMRTKLGLVPGSDDDDREVAEGFLAILERREIDFTNAFRDLATSLRTGAPPSFMPVDDDGATSWYHGWLERVDRDAAQRMDAVNPVHIPRNHLVEEALAAATDGDLAPITTLVEVLGRPFERGDVDGRFAQPAPDSFGPYRTFCGT